MIHAKQLWLISIFSILCTVTVLSAQIEDVPASQEMYEDDAVPDEPAPPPAKKSDAYSGATEIIVDPVETLYQELKTNGHAVIEGIAFNNDNTLKIESDSCLDVLAQMLKDHPKMNVYIVGHTDNKAGAFSGMLTSQKRAEAVMNTLSSRFEIDIDRLFASGVGPLSPITTNDTEEGRVKNNRIELVIQ
jgi:outer membrane protein OmpA-like peptidoglycan-associated protein